MATLKPLTKHLTESSFQPFVWLNGHFSPFTNGLKLAESRVWSFKAGAETQIKDLSCFYNGIQLEMCSWIKDWRGWLHHGRRQVASAVCFLDSAACRLSALKYKLWFGWINWQLDKLLSSSTETGRAAASTPLFHLPLSFLSGALTFPQLRFQETNILSSLLSLSASVSPSFSLPLSVTSPFTLFSHPRRLSEHFGQSSCSTPQPPLPSH